MITAYQAGSPMLKAYIDMNGIKSAFYFKTDERQYTVYAGDAVTRQGFEEGVYKTKREAVAKCDQINTLIESVEK